MKTLVRISLLMIATLMMGCSSDKAQVTAVSDDSSLPVTVVGYGSNSSKALPKAVIYRTNGDYTDNVPVNMNEQHTALASYPAPSDITSYSTPVDLGDGWLLDRRGGVGINTVFLSYTYPQYAALKSTPSSGQLMDKVIPGSGVTRCIATPVSLNDAMANPEILKQYIPR